MKEVIKFLKKNPAIKVEVTGSHSQKTKGFLLSGRLALLNRSRDILYLLSYVDVHNSSRFVPTGHVAFLDTLYKIDDQVEYVFEPERFFTELTYTREIEEDMFKISIDGEDVFKINSKYKWDRARDSYLRERKLGNMDFKHMITYDINGYRSDFIED